MLFHKSKKASVPSIRPQRRKPNNLIPSRIQAKQPPPKSVSITKTWAPSQVECPNHAGSLKGSKQKLYSHVKGQSSAETGVDRRALGKMSWITHRRSSTKRSTIQSKSPQQDLANNEDDDSEVADTQFYNFDSTPLSQSDDQWFKRKLSSSPCRHLQSGININQQESTLMMRITPQLLYPFSSPSSSQPTVEEDDNVPGMVNLSQVNLAGSNASPQELEPSIVPDSFNCPPTSIS